MAFEVGSDVEAMCRTCGDVWHVIVAKIGDKITKVECKECGNQHRFKPTGAAPAANLTGERRKVPVTKVAKVSVAAGTFDPTKPTRDYSMRERFAVGEQIRHPKFGNGVVCTIEDDKIHVSFDGVGKILRHARAS